MKPALLIPALMTLVLPLPPARAVIHLLLEDPHDDGKVVVQIRANPEVQELRDQFDLLHKRMLAWEERDFRALFGAPREFGSAEYALPTFEDRVIALSGIRFADPAMNKDHVDGHALGKYARIDVYYGIDGTTVVHVHFYLAIDKEFVKLRSIDDLKARLDWERPRLASVIDHVNERWREEIVWEFDVNRAESQFSGVYSGDPAIKLQAMIEWGKANGYRLEQTPAGESWGPCWFWYSGKILIAKAYQGPRVESGGCCFEFTFNREDGALLRDERAWKYVDMIRWYRPDGSLWRAINGSMHDGVWRPYSWSWEFNDVRGRGENDTNGDGIPDSYSVTEYEPENGNYREIEGGVLTIDQSWAVHPELIPEPHRIPDEWRYQVPIRRIQGRHQRGRERLPATGADNAASGFPSSSGDWSSLDTLAFISTIVVSGLILTVLCVFGVRRRRVRGSSK